MEAMRILVFIFIFVLTSCQTTTEFYDFKKLRKGMEKGEVIETIGVPVRKDRKDQRDWWYYRFYEEGLKFERMVVFDSGKLIYAGRVTVRKGTDNSNQIDQLNERTNELAPTEQNKASE